MYVFVDGGCVGNGGRAPRASFAAVIVGAPLAGELTISGPVAGSEYAWDTATGRLVDGAARAAPSNNRAELLAIVAGLGAATVIAGSGRPLPIELLSDSLISVRTLGEWLPARRRAGTETALANFDLVSAAETILVRARALTTVTVTHVPGHAAAPPAGAPPRARLLQAGNDAADRAATACLVARSPLTVTASHPADAVLAELVRAQLPVG